MIKIAGGQGFFGIAQHPRQLTDSGILESGINGGGVHLCIEHNGQINRRHIDGWHTHGLRLKAPCQLWQQAIDTQCQPCVYRDNRLHSSAGFAQISMMVGIDYRLVIHGRVNGGDHTALYTKVVIEHFDYWHHTVGRTGCGGHYGLLSA